MFGNAGLIAGDAEEEAGNRNEEELEMSGRAEGLTLDTFAISSRSELQDPETLQDARLMACNAREHAESTAGRKAR
jgi:hypothetical protein